MTYTYAFIRKCHCGTEVFRLEGKDYNADFTKQYPAEPPLLHGCDAGNSASEKTG